MSSAFSRSKAVFAAIAAVLATGVSIASIASNPKFGYSSRGHGMGRNSGKGVGNVGTDWMARLNGNTNGKRECERRMRQMARASA